jgi:hypothetical protein
VADAPTSKSLLARAGEGSDQAWRRLMEVYQPLIGRWVRPPVAQAAGLVDLF